jgi:hypothetical protein
MSCLESYLDLVIISMLILQNCKCVLLWWQNYENEFIDILILVKHIFLSIPSCEIGTLKEKIVHCKYVHFSSQLPTPKKLFGHTKYVGNKLNI